VPKLGVVGGAAGFQPLVFVTTKAPTQFFLSALQPNIDAYYRHFDL
jgi:hypothetical protein